MTLSTAPNLLPIVKRRRVHFARFLKWAADREVTGRSLRWQYRSDISEARTAAALFPEEWWGLLVFTCFWWSKPPIQVIDYFQRPRSVRQAEAFLKRADLPSRSVGGHRIRPGHNGAKDALVSACGKHNEFRQILTGDLGGFDVRFRATRHLTGVRSWGRTTCFDLILRAGSLGLGGHKYSPELAYLAEATGPAHGFEIIFGKHPRTDPSGSEALLHDWTASWDEIVQVVNVEWTGPPYDSGDFENALCIYQEQPNPGAC